MVGTLVDVSQNFWKLVDVFFPKTGIFSIQVSSILVSTREIGGEGTCVEILSKFWALCRSIFSKKWPFFGNEFKLSELPMGGRDAPTPLWVLDICAPKKSLLFNNNPLFASFLAEINPFYWTIRENSDFFSKKFQRNMDMFLCQRVSVAKTARKYTLLWLFLCCIGLDW